MRRAKMLNIGAVILGLTLYLVVFPLTKPMLIGTLTEFLADSQDSSVEKMQHETIEGYDFYSPYITEGMKDEFKNIAHTMNRYVEDDHIFTGAGTTGFKIVVFPNQYDLQSHFSRNILLKMKGGSGYILGLTLSDKSMFLQLENISSKLIVHEYTHYMQKSYERSIGIGGGRIPIWFTEGLAEYEAGNLPASFDMSKEYNLMSLERGNEYLVGNFAIRKIIEIGGKEAIYEIYGRMKEESFYDALESTIDMSLDKLEKSMITEYRYKLVMRADDEIQRGQYAKAIGDLETFLESYPGNIEALCMLADVHIVTNSINDAIAALEEAYSSSSDEMWPKSKSELALLYMVTGNPLAKNLLDELKGQKYYYVQFKDQINLHGFYIEKLENSENDDEKLKIFTDLASGQKDHPALGCMIISYALEKYSTPDSMAVKDALQAKGRLEDMKNGGL